MGTPRLDKLDKNLLINGNFNFWQRGTSFAVSAGGSDALYSSDKWGHTNYISSGSYTISQSSDIPTGLKNCLVSYKYQCTSAISFAGSDHHLFVGLHRIEGIFASKVFNKKVTLRFWVKSSVAGDYNALIGDAYGPAGARYLIPYTITSANTWQLVKKVITIDTSYGVFNNAFSEGLFISFPLAGGTVRQVSSLSTWLSSSIGEITTATNRTELLNLNATFQLAQISLTEGEDLNEFPFIPYEDEFLLCKRYYQRAAHIFGTVNNSTTITGWGRYEVPMRVAPAAIQTGLLNFQNGVGSYTQSSSSLSAVAMGTDEYVVSCGNFSGMTPGQSGSLGIPANNTNVIYFSADL